MAVILDAGPLIAAVDQADPLHARVAALLLSLRETIIVSPFVLAEADYIVSRRNGTAAELAMLRGVANDMTLEMISPADLITCAQIVQVHAQMDIGLADASLIVIAARHRTTRIATFDLRHFRALRSLQGEPFVLLPWDEDQRAE